jgi:hypothetical protein
MLGLPQLIILNAISIVVINNRIRPIKKIMSAKFSYRAPNLFVLRMERKERMLLVINISMASAVISSIIVVSCSFSTFSEVSTRKQNPSRFDEVLSICCEFPFLEFLLSESLFITFF